MKFFINDSFSNCDQIRRKLSFLCSGKYILVHATHLSYIIIMYISTL